MPEYYDDLDQELQQATSGGGMICEVAVYGAYQVYASGVSPSERIFLYGGSKKKDEARAKAEVLAGESGGRIEQTLCTVQYKDSVLGRDVSHWKGDRFHTYGPFWGADAKAFNELRKELGLKSATKTWVRLGSMTSPNAEANKDKAWAWEENQNGEKQLKRIQLPVAVFADRKAAQEAAASSGAATTTSDESWPGNFGDTEWTPGDWNDTAKPMIAEMYADKKPVPLIAKEMGAPVEAIKLALAQLSAS